MKRRELLRILCFISFLLCIVFLMSYVYEGYHHQKEAKKLASFVPVQDSNERLSEIDESHEEQKLEPLKHEKVDNAIKETEIQQKNPILTNRFQQIIDINSDFVGWLEFLGTNIDYPVVQRDNSYYLTHNFYLEEEKHGCLFVDVRCDVEKPSTNTIIYGHNMKDQTMFAQLFSYEKEDFFRVNPSIKYTTLYEESSYEVAAVFYSKVFLNTDTDFKFYQFIDIDSKEEWDDYVKNIKSLSIYDTDVDLQYGDTLLTLTTCSYHEENGRFVVIAKKV